MSNESALEIREATRRFRGRPALDGCRGEIPVGSVTALVGPNAAGKSTLLAAVAGLLPLDDGEIRVFGDPVRSGLHPRAAYLAQRQPLYRRLTVGATLRFGSDTNPRWDADIAEQVIDVVGIDRRATVGRLSGGQHAAVAIALTLGRSPDLLLLDEPFAAIDPLVRDELQRLLMSVVAERGMTVLLSSHHLVEVADICDHLMVLDHGRTELLGPTEDLLAEHRILVGPSSAVVPVTTDQVIHRRVADRQQTVLVRSTAAVPEGWAAAGPGLEGLVLGYLRRGAERIAVPEAELRLITTSRMGSRLRG